MPTPLATQTAVRNRVMDTDDQNPLLTDTQIDQAITEALSRYTNDRPRELTADITGTGSTFYPLTGTNKVLASWIEGVSQILSIDYPAAAVSATYSPTWLDPSFDWTIYSDSTLVYLRFLTVTPKATEKARTTYTAPHVHTTVLNTIPAGDADAVWDLAASYACQMLATHMAAAQDSLIASDSQNYRDGQLRFQQQAKAWEDSYKTRLNISDSGAAGASAVADWNRTATTGWPMLTHSKYWR